MLAIKISCVKLTCSDTNAKKINEQNVYDGFVIAKYNPQKRKFIRYKNV